MPNAAKLLRLTAAFSLCLMLSLGSAPAHAAVLSLAPLSNTAAVGDRLFVDVVVSGLAPGQALAAYDLDILFDDAVLNPFSVTFSGLLGVPGDAQFTAATTSPGRIDFAAVTFASGPELLALQGPSFVLAQLAFDAVSPGRSTLIFDLLSPPGLLLGDQFADRIDATSGPAVELMVTGEVAVPEPGSLALAAAGLLAMFLRARRGSWRDTFRIMLPSTSRAAR